MAAKARRTKRLGKRIKVVDLFCGIGGLSHGLLNAGLTVAAGVDNDPSCKFAFEKNNGAKFILRDVAKFTARELKALFRGAQVKVLVGCAPCQPFSSLNRKRLTKRRAQQHWYPLYRFMRLIRAVKPDIVSMENVPELANEKKYPVFSDFIECLDSLGYKISFCVVDAAEYGVPQRRRRLVLLASRLGDISLVRGRRCNAKKFATVAATIRSLPRLVAGEADPSDPLHRASSLSKLNRMRIAATPKNGGSAKSWNKKLVPPCYRRRTGKSYMCTVYGRMRWNTPAPTMTTQCTTLGTGRFGHPVQDRAISLREAALLQTFPKKYKFAQHATEISMRNLARHIGNAVPVRLGRAIGASLRAHIATHL